MLNRPAPNFHIFLIQSNIKSDIHNFSLAKLAIKLEKLIFNDLIRGLKCSLVCILQGSVATRSGYDGI